MNAFLKQTKAALSSAEENVMIVIGNESCDLDSMTSAILYAWFRSHQPPKGAFSNTYIPVLNIPKEDLDLRPEFKALFQHCDIDANNLVTVTDIHQADHLPIDQTQWVLVDHNRLEGDFKDLYSEQVVGCIDHHQDEDAVPREPGPEPRVIEVCGSCTSLVVRELAVKLSTESSDLKDVPPYSTDALKLGLASILIDTHNLQDKNKVTEVDKSMANYTDAALRRRDPAWNKDEFFDELSKAKKNLKDLDVDAILRKDYKQWTEGNYTLGISSVVKDLGYVFRKHGREIRSPDILESWSRLSEHFMALRGLDVWVIMTAYTVQGVEDEEVFQRQLMIYWRDVNAASIVNTFEENNYLKGLDLVTTDGEFDVPSHADSWNIWQQSDTSASRKQIAPMLRKIMKNAPQE